MMDEDKPRTYVRESRWTRWPRRLRQAFPHFMHRKVRVRRGSVVDGACGFCHRRVRGRALAALETPAAEEEE